MNETLFSQMQQITDFWKKAADEQMTRSQAMWGEYEKLVTTTTTQANTFIEEWAKVAKAQLAYSNQLATDWRKMFNANATA